VTKTLLATAITGLAALLAGCPAAGSRSCTASPVTFPDGNCSAYYYQSALWFGDSTTQALVNCAFDKQQVGGNVVAFHNTNYGIGLRWLSANTLEVAVPDGIELDNQRHSSLYMGHKLTYRYRTLKDMEPEFTGCLAGHRGGT